ncbi:hypothetical protein HQ865_15325 [Mucilaginibacter mali]|uniref:DUF5977 domain-containing protein n=1 Tax=Mucilaginibacter mali TaxID=2740462 RepID=A0A7D4Q4L7_9SPHI|nr:DUF5977 domain-containing protein [Mucilaginibacter mali]QKJ31067.1 hypothetical protein HQ865_15325 [Mucilaginibacter mali]
MKIKLNFIIALILLLKTASVLAQHDPTNYIKPQLVPASPTAANLGKYGDVPVNMSTGMANVSVPIFTVQGQDISLPISLSYNYNGARPSEQTSWIGLGWSLQAGGVITRQIRGRIDENNTTDPYAYENLYNTSLIYDTGDTFLRAVATGDTYDTEPDIYSFNFNGHSGKFIQIKNQFYVFPYQKIKITGDAGVGYSITTEDGTKYDFYTTENTTVKSTPGGANWGTYHSAYYLNQVTNAAQTESIFLTYQGESDVIQNGAYSQSYDRSNFRTSGWFNPYDPGIGTESTLYPLQTTMPSRVSAKRLDRIYSSKFEVDFIPESTERQDQANSYALHSILVTASGGSTIKSVVLNHDYSDSQYLKLSSVSEINLQNDGGLTSPTDSLVQKFTYADGLPARNNPTVGTDHYGYYNGTTTNLGGKLIPGYIAGSDIGANREPNPAFAMAGILTKITYPTGGTTNLEYESNTFTGAARKDNIGVSRSATRHDYTTTNDFYIFSRPFTIDLTQKVYISLSRFPKDTVGPPDDNLKLKDNKDPEAVIYDSSNNVVYTGRINAYSLNGGYQDSIMMSPGTYTLRVECDATENYTTAGVGFTKTSTELENINGHGLRIKKITSNPVIGTPLVKTYAYEGGTALMPAYDSHDYYRRIHDDPTPGFEGVYHDYSYTIFNSSLEQGTALGLPFYYRTVTEYTGPDTAALKSVYTFDSQDDGSNFMGIDPVGEYHYKKVGNNYNLLSSKVSQYTIGTIDAYFYGIKTYVNIREIYHYTHYNDYNYYAPIGTYVRSEFKYLQSTKETTYNTDTLSTTTINEYSPTTHNLLSVKTLSSDGVLTTQKFKYPEDYNSTIGGSLVTANVTGPIEKQIWRKAPGGSSVMIGGSITQFDNTLLKPTAIYALENTTGLSTLSNETQDGSSKYNTLLSDSHYQQKVNYYYDSYAKINRQQLTGGISMSYKYGNHPVAGVYLVAIDTNQTNYPVAECKNCQPTEFFTENFEDGSYTAGAAHTGSKYYNGTSYTVNWTLPNSRSYVISYWYKSGTWKYSGEIAFTGTYTMSNGTAYDDIRVYPADAQVSTYTYNLGVGLNATIDAKGLTSYYEYDGFNRLRNIKDQYGRILKNNSYNYAAPRYANAEINQVLTRANSTCSSGNIGARYVYRVPGGTYLSTVSQADADAQAQAEVTANAQTSANANGGCVIPVQLSFVNHVTNGSAQLYTLTVKNAQGEILYTFNTAALTSTTTPALIPKGVYTFEFYTYGDCVDNLDYGWNNLYLTKGTSTTAYKNVLSDCISTYVIKNIDLTDTGLCTINMEGNNVD